MTRRAACFITLLLVILVCSAVRAGLAQPQDNQETSVQHSFGEGMWMPDENPALIGPTNYSTLENMRYTATGLEGVQGYTKINTSAVDSTYKYITNGHQLRTNFDTESYVLIQAENSDGSASKVYKNTASIPDQGNFTATAVHTDATGAGVGRMASGPGGAMLYCNGKETYVWGGDEILPSGFSLVDDADGTNPRDYTDAVRNELDTSGNYATIDKAGQEFALVFSKRPLRGVYFTVKTANSSASTMTCKYWDGSSFAAVTNPSDGTSSGGKALAQSGWFTFDSTVDSAKPHHFEEVFLYAYLFELSAGSAAISHVTVNAPWQQIVDVWDGQPRAPIGFFVDNGTVQDYSAHVLGEYITYGGKAEIGGLTDLDEIYVVTDERASALQITMYPTEVNTAAATLIGQYWDGDSWTAMSWLDDGTNATDGQTFGQSGLVAWNPPDATDEFQRTFNGVTGYIYRFRPSSPLSDTVAIDLVTYRPAPNPPAQGYKFPAVYKDRFLLCNYEDGGEHSRIDYSQSNSDVWWRGEIEDVGGLQTIYVGGDEPLVAGTQLYNRFGSNIFSTFVALKRNETFLINESDEGGFQVFQISSNVGCCAPLTLATTETGFDMAPEVVRNTAIWLDYSGPMLFDGAVLMPIEGVDNYFDPVSDDFVGYSAMTGATGWYDSLNREYNLVIGDLWLCYDLVKKRWFKKDVGTATMVDVAWPVTDENGARYIYAGADNGFVYRMENGNSWDGVPIRQSIVTGDFWPSSSTWDVTRIRRFKLGGSAISEDHFVAVTHITDTKSAALDVEFTDWPGGAWVDWTGGAWVRGESPVLNLRLYSEDGASLVWDTSECNFLGSAHRMEFDVSTSETPKGFRPTWWAYEYQIVRKDK